MATKYDKMSMTELKKIAKSIGYSDGKSLDKDTLADAIHQFDVAGMLNNTAKKSAGMSVGTDNYSNKKKKKVPTPKARPTKQERTEHGYMNDPDAPKYIIKDGYMVLKEKSQNIPTPKARPKMQRKKEGGSIGRCNRLY